MSLKTPLLRLQQLYPSEYKVSNQRPLSPHPGRSVSVTGVNHRSSPFTSLRGAGKYPGRLACSAPAPADPPRMVSGSLTSRRQGSPTQIALKGDKAYLAASGPDTASSNLSPFSLADPTAATASTAGAPARTTVLSNGIRGRTAPSAVLEQRRLASRNMQGRRSPSHSEASRSPTPVMQREGCSARRAIKPNGHCVNPCASGASRTGRQGQSTTTSPLPRTGLRGRETSARAPSADGSPNSRVALSNYGHTSQHAGVSKGGSCAREALASTYRSSRVGPYAQGSFPSPSRMSRLAQLTSKSSEPSVLNDKITFAQRDDGITSVERLDKLAMRGWEEPSISWLPLQPFPRLKPMASAASAIDVPTPSSPDHLVERGCVSSPVGAYCAQSQSPELLGSSRSEHSIILNLSPLTRIVVQVGDTMSRCCSPSCVDHAAAGAVEVLHSRGRLASFHTPSPSSSSSSPLLTAAPSLNSVVRKPTSLFGGLDCASGGNWEHRKDELPIYKGDEPDRGNAEVCRQSSRVATLRSVFERLADRTAIDQKVKPLRREEKQREPVAVARDPTKILQRLREEELSKDRLTSRLLHRLHEIVGPEYDSLCSLMGDTSMESFGSVRDCFEDGRSKSTTTLLAQELLERHVGQNKSLQQVLKALRLVDGQGNEGLLRRVLSGLGAHEAGGALVKDPSELMSLLSDSLQSEIDAVEGRRSRVTDTSCPTTAQTVCSSRRCSTIEQQDEDVDEHSIVHCDASGSLQSSIEDAPGDSIGENIERSLESAAAHASTLELVLEAGSKESPHGSVHCPDGQYCRFVEPPLHPPRTILEVPTPFRRRFVSGDSKTASCALAGPQEKVTVLGTNDNDNGGVDLNRGFEERNEPIAIGARLLTTTANIDSSSEFLNEDVSSISNPPSPTSMVISQQRLGDFPIGSEECAASLEDQSFRVEESVYIPRPGEQSLERRSTLLHLFEQEQLKREVNIIVPDGMRDDRLVQFVYEGERFDVIVPPDLQIGQQFAVHLPRRSAPPLERNRNHAHVRDHDDFPVFSLLWAVLAHPPGKCVDYGFSHEELKMRVSLYYQLGGRSMAPLLPFTAEEEEEDIQ